jgi:hypothetical protein
MTREARRPTVRVLLARWRTGINRANSPKEVTLRVYTPCAVRGYTPAQVVGLDLGMPLRPKSGDTSASASSHAGPLWSVQCWPALVSPVLARSGRSRRRPLWLARASISAAVRTATVPLPSRDHACDGAVAVVIAHVTVPLRTLPSCGDGVIAVVGLAAASTGTGAGTAQEDPVTDPVRESHRKVSGKRTTAAVTKPQPLPLGSARPGPDYSFSGSVRRWVSSWMSTATLASAFACSLP